jgi:hypothetical protein
MKKFYLFQERGVTEMFFCGNIYQAMPNDEIKYHGQLMMFIDCATEGVCKEFLTRKEANNFSRMEEDSMQDSNNYANQAMQNEDTYGCEGVDY